MVRTVPDDIDLLTTRVRLGIPLEGFDGCPIPLRHPDGRGIDPIDAAQILLRSGAAQLPDDEAAAYVERSIERARRVELASSRAGDLRATTVAKVVAVLVGAAIRATILARHADASPSDLNQATLAWYGTPSADAVSSAGIRP